MGLTKLPKGTTDTCRYCHVGIKLGLYSVPAIYSDNEMQDVYGWFHLKPETPDHPESCPAVEGEEVYRRKRATPENYCWEGLSDDNPNHFCGTRLRERNEYFACGTHIKPYLERERQRIFAAQARQQREEQDAIRDWERAVFEKKVERVAKYGLSVKAAYSYNHTEVLANIDELLSVLDEHVTTVDSPPEEELMDVDGNFFE